MHVGTSPYLQPSLQYPWGLGPLVSPPQLPSAQSQDGSTDTYGAGQADPRLIQQMMQQVYFQMLAWEMLQMLIDYLGNYGPEQASRNPGRMPQQGYANMQRGGGWNQSAPSSAANGTAPSTENLPQGNGSVGSFLDAALAQNGDRYVYGAETRLDDPDPDTFDCSELVQWAAAQAGVQIPDGSANQRSWCRQQGTEISVEEALRTPGALLFKDGHVAISLGDGRTIEAMGSKYGVKIANGAGRFTSGGLVPGMTYG